MLEAYRMVDRFRVGFADVDLLRHVNNTTYLRWVEQMRTEYFAEVFGERVGGVHGMILARTEIVYERPIAYREYVAVGTRVSRIGTKSFAFSHEVWSDDHGLRCARIETTLVAINYETGETIVVPDAWRNASPPTKRPLSSHSTGRLRARRTRTAYARLETASNLHARARSSGGERYIDTVEVIGSKPIVPTTKNSQPRVFDFRSRNCRSFQAPARLA